MSVGSENGGAVMSQPFALRETQVRKGCLKRGILPNERIFPIKRRAVYNVLEKVTNYLGYKNISTHSFRRFFATNIYESSGKDILIVQEILQHSSPICTRKYIGISPQRIEDALVANVNLVSGY